MCIKGDKDHPGLKIAWGTCGHVFHLGKYISAKKNTIFIFRQAISSNNSLILGNPRKVGYQYFGINFPFNIVLYNYLQCLIVIT